MPYSVSGTDVSGVYTVNRKTPELALRKGPRADQAWML